MQNTWIWIIVAIVVIGGGFFWWQSMQPAADTGTPTTVTDTTGTGATGSTDTSGGTTTTPPMTATVTYSGTSFTPSTVTIANGGTVTFVDSSGRGMWIASGQHPTHQAYDGTSQTVHCAAGYTGPAPFDACASVSSFKFTFTKTGTWGFHDHLNAQLGGTVIVQ